MGGVDAGEALRRAAEVFLADAHDAEVALLLAAAEGVFPAGPHGELFAGEEAAGEAFALLAERNDARFGDVEIAGLLAVAVAELFVAFGGVHEVEANDVHFVAVADVEAVAVHVAVGEDGVFPFFPFAGVGSGGAGGC